MGSVLRGGLGAVLVVGGLACGARQRPAVDDSRSEPTTDRDARIEAQRREEAQLAKMNASSASEGQPHESASASKGGGEDKKAACDAGDGSACSPLADSLKTMREDRARELAARYYQKACDLDFRPACAEAQRSTAPKSDARATAPKVSPQACGADPGDGQILREAHALGAKCGPACKGQLFPGWTTLTGDCQTCLKPCTDRCSGTGHQLALSCSPASSSCQNEIAVMARRCGDACMGLPCRQ